MNRIDLWIDNLTIKQSLITFFAAIVAMGAIVGMMALLIGYSGFVALLAGLGAIGVVLGWYGVRLAIKVWMRLRQNERGV